MLLTFSREENGVGVSVFFFFFFFAHTWKMAFCAPRKSLH
jgi:hypothetical protein